MLFFRLVRSKFKACVKTDQLLEKIKILFSPKKKNLHDINNVSKYSDCRLGLAGEWSCSSGHKQGLFGLSIMTIYCLMSGSLPSEQT